MNKLFAVALLVAFVFAGPVSAQTQDLPEAGLTPASPFYFVERIFEGIGTVLTFGNSAKAQRLLTLSEERLAEAKALAEEGDERAQEAVGLYEEQIEKARERAGSIDDELQGIIDFGLRAQITDATTKHLTALDEVLERVPEQAKASIKAAKERSVTSQIEALRGIAQRDPERAVDIFDRAAEGRLMSAQARADRGGEDEEENINDALEEFGEYAEFGQEISSLAQGLETGTSTVEELVQRATSRHLEILQEVQSRVPQQAQEGIQRAIENAQRAQDNRPEIPSPSEARGNTGAGNAPVETTGGVPSNGEEENGENQEETENGNGNPPVDTPVTPDNGAPDNVSN